MTLCDLKTMRIYPHRWRAHRLLVHPKRNSQSESSDVTSRVKNWVKKGSNIRALRLITTTYFTLGNIELYVTKINQGINSNIKKFEF